MKFRQKYPTVAEELKRKGKHLRGDGGRRNFGASSSIRMVPNSSMRRMKIRTAAKAEKRQGNSIKLAELCECTNGFYAACRAVHQRHTNLIPNPDNRSHADRGGIFRRSRASSEFSTVDVFHRLSLLMRRRETT